MIIGVGCDIVKIDRIVKAMKNEKFLDILSEREKQIFISLQGKRQQEWLAGRFAAKEAIYKAIHKQYPCVISNIEVLCDNEGMPICSYEDIDIFISISHEAEYAIAYATAVSKE